MKSMIGDVSVIFLKRIHVLQIKILIIRVIVNPISSFCTINIFSLTNGRNSQCTTYITKLYFPHDKINLSHKSYHLSRVHTL